MITMHKMQKLRDQLDIILCYFIETSISPNIDYKINLVEFFKTIIKINIILDNINNIVMYINN